MDENGAVISATCKHMLAFDNALCFHVVVFDELQQQDIAERLSTGYA